jgi:nicotinate-nucleotide adenylyltransferase
MTPSKATRRVAVYGGTFDPVHLGHLQVARRILGLFALDEVLFMPALIAPHKHRDQVASAFHRYTMLALATEQDQWLKISTMELERPEHPYTVETIERLQKKFGVSRRLFFVMGADSWVEFETWREWERLLELCDHIVVTRPGYALRPNGIPAEKVLDVRQFNEQQLAVELNRNVRPRVFVTDAVMLDISATAIRAAVAAADQTMLRQSTPGPVADYIEKYSLYQKANESELEREQLAL